VRFRSFGDRCALVNAVTGRYDLRASVACCDIMPRHKQAPAAEYRPSFFKHRKSRTTNLRSSQKNCFYNQELKEKRSASCRNRVKILSKEAISLTKHNRRNSAAPISPAHQSRNPRARPLVRQSWRSPIGRRQSNGSGRHRYHDDRGWTRVSL